LIVTYIDSVAGNRDGDGLRWGVESICAQLTELGAKIAPSSYYEHRDRPPTAREVRDADLKPKVARAYVENYGVYGARTIWLTLNRERSGGAPPIARCTVERLMAELGLRGAVRGKVKRTTISDPHAAKPHDLVDRNFSPRAPDRLWVADFTYVSTWSGWCYTAFVIDAYARRILGWSVATTMTSRFVVDAVEQAIWTRGREGRDLAGLIAHHDHGVQYLSVAYSEPLATAGIKPSTGAVGSSLRQRARGVGDRALQDRADQAQAAVEGPRRSRDRHRGMGRQVQPPPALRVLRRPHAGRSRAGSLRSPQTPTPVGVSN
jgi:putative transposase